MAIGVATNMYVKYLNKIPNIKCLASLVKYSSSSCWNFGLSGQDIESIIMAYERLWTIYIFTNHIYQLCISNCITAYVTDSARI